MATTMTMAAPSSRIRAIRRSEGLRSRRCVVTRAVRDTRRLVRTHAERGTRLDVQAVIPMLQGDATEQTPPDLPSFLFKNRIVYLVRRRSAAAETQNLGKVPVGARVLRDRTCGKKRATDRI